MTNTTLTTEEKEDDRLAGILGREKEIEGYQLNIDNYTEVLKTLPADDWPESIKQYKVWGHDTQKLAENVPDADLSLVSDYAFRDRVIFLKKTEELEQRKSKLSYDGIIASVKVISGDDDTALNVKLAAKKISLATEAAAAK